MRGRHDGGVAGHILGGHDEVRAWLQVHRPRGERSEPNLRPLQVDQNPDAPPAGIGGFANSEVGLSVVLVISVREVQTGHIHASIHQCPNLLGRGGRRAQRDHDFGSAHGAKPSRNRLHGEGPRRCSNGRRKVRVTRQVPIDARSGRATFRDSPHDQGLAPARIPRDEDSIN